MSDDPANDGGAARIDHAAAAWVLRLDRGLNPAEQDEYSEWLAADPRHRAAIARHRGNWQRLDQLAQWRPEHGTRPNPDLLAPPARARLRRFASVTVLLAAAAGVAFVAAWWRLAPEQTPSGLAAAPTVAAAGPRVLEDGTVVELNRGATITVAYAPAERRVVLERGEAHFAVQRDAARPFVVRAGGIDVRAVGTAFNVRVETTAVEVLVTEGSVELAAVPPRPAADPVEKPRALLVPSLGVRQRAVISRTADLPAPEIATLTTGEIERVLAWQHRLLDFTAAPLHEVVAEFNRRNVVQLVVVDPELAAIRVSAALRSDNIDGFVRLLEAGFGARAERRGETEIVLRAAR